MSYDNTNRGVLRKNERKTKESQPGYRGDININGQEYWLSAWVNEHPNMGGKYFSLSVEAKESPKAQPTEVQQPIDDEIPF